MGKSKGKRKAVEIDEEDLNRFAGSSEEEEEEEEELEEEEEEMKDVEGYADNEGDTDSSEDDDSIEDDNDAVQSDDEILETELESSSAKMANAMARILGTTKKSAGSNVVLSKTTTPLQRLQKKEKEQAKALKEKRQANRERNLTALHIPLSVATTNTIEMGKSSVAQELEQERLHRRVATRGVVALFNAITQHQKATEVDQPGIKNQGQETKMTKHSFLSKIKDAASAGHGGKVDDKTDNDTETKQQSSKWDALKDDYLLNPKKNWDQESSSDEEESISNDPLVSEEEAEVEQKTTKRRRKLVQ